MPKKPIIEDMKSKGVKITMITKNDLVSKKTSLRSPEPVKNEDLSLEETEGIKNVKHIFDRPKREKISHTPVVRGSKMAVRKSFLFVLLIVIILSGAYYLTNMFQKADVYIEAKSQVFTLDHKQFSASNFQNTSLHFELMIVSTEDYKDITLATPQTVSNKAKGSVTLFNAFSTKAVTISAHTFLADPSGKTYQTDNAVTIPGYKTVGGKITPGQVSVGVTAFLPGKEYNGSPSDFTINAYKGTPKASKIYGKLKTALSGGAQGTVYALSSTEKGQVNATAESTFKSNMIKKVNAEVPPGYILFPDAMNFSYTVDSDTLFNTPNARVKITGTIASIILSKKDLSNVLVKNLLPDISPRELKEVSLVNIENLKFNFATAGQTITKDLKNVSFALTGNVNGVWTPDTAALTSSLPGALKSGLQDIFKLDPGIVKASATIFPPWQSYMPTDTSKINIIVK